VQDATDGCRPPTSQWFMVNVFRSAVIAVALTLGQPGAGTAQTSAPTNDVIPSFQVAIRVDPLTDFTVRVDAYSELRRGLEDRLPEVTVTDSVVRQIRRERRSLARAIRGARVGAFQGEFFTPATSAQLHLVLDRVVDTTMCASIMEDNPGAGGFPRAIDGTYPEGKTLSTMPGLLLARLPGLPGDIQFRFVGRDLILYDVRANTIIDRMPNAIRCGKRDD
jgi:hypothetical protein